ncbi:uncharacterized protein I303_100792 [Kwoniella dejecticola CBS 10117]|uniref:Uncharacterized protein n=1 Tax=Kwoniella dejecticola CBS 10117 TaxID=1296121 RepID=A0A1A6AFZ3_9TREE|nr:uncharacterized protein I303_00794 [Kwoniella dejecticola CBS 10117]OBR88974.1 hypothetical protein I303_00794 [Kwoniella dejecticola CBS 10117]
MAYRAPPPSTFHQQYQQPQRQGSIRKMPSAKEIASSGSFVSPLTRLEAEGRSARSRANSTSTSSANANASASTSFPVTQPLPQPSSQPLQQSAPAPPVPTLEFGNMFRNSRYSVDSLSSIGSRDSFASYGTISGTDQETEEGYESPSTPKASTSRQGQQSYFEAQQRSRTPSPSKRPQRDEGLQMKDFGRTRIPASNSSTTLNGSANANGGALTPKRSFSVTSRSGRIPSDPSKPLPPNPAATLPSSHGAFNLEAVPMPRNGSRSRSGSDAYAKEVSEIHRPEETEMTADWASMHGEQGSDWGDDESQFEWVDTEGAPEATNGIEGKGSPSKRLSRFKAAVTAVGVSTEGRQKLKKPLVIHRRAPPPPPNTAPAAPIPEPISPNKRLPHLPATISHPTMMMPIPRPAHTEIPKRAGTIRTASSNSSRALVRTQNSEKDYRSDDLVPPQAPFSSGGSGGKRPSPLMVPMKVDDGPSSPMDAADSQSRHSHMSFQSVAYSFYDLDGDHSPATTPKPNEAGDLVFPHGKYVKVSASTLERDRQRRERTISESTTSSAGDAGKTPEQFVHAGIEARGKGDLAKSAWYFMRAAEGRSATGRMYWGLALRHGWGVARDDRRAFIELRQACEETLAEGGLDFHKSPGHVKLTQQQKKSMQKELSLGMFEVGNCFLDGIGVKKSPDVALAYLRFAAGMGDIASQEQLGFLLSKGSNGVKKDMKEAARWYRMAIANGSSNTFGLAWIWKDKYMT